MERIDNLLEVNAISKNKVIVVEPGEFAFTDDQKSVLATDYTFSCTNFLAYNDNFAYLLHMFPSEAVGKNNKFLEHLEIFKKYFEENCGSSSILNVKVICGFVENEENDYKVHNLVFINEQLKLLENYFLTKGIQFNRLEDGVSK